MLSRSDQPSAPERLALRGYILLIVLLFIILVLRLLFLQVLDSNPFTLKSINNIIQPVPTPAPRGNIYDRKGGQLAVNETVSRLLYKPPLDIAKYFPSLEELAQLKAAGQQPKFLYDGSADNPLNGKPLDEVQRLGAYIGVPYPQLMAGLQRELLRLNGNGYYGYKPATLIDKLTYPQVVYLEEHRDEYQGFFIDDSFERNFPLGQAGAHLLGFTGYASDSDAGFIKNMGFTNQEKVGKDGVEMQYEAMLHGRQGRRNVEVDHNRVFQDIVSVDPPQKGTDIFLTIDSHVQQVAWNALAGRRGTIVVAALMPGHEGEIIALVSSPAFDPIHINEYDYFNKLNSDTQVKPMLNRAYRGTFVPGSTFKIVSATAALQTRTITPGTTFGCGGKLSVGNRDFYCWNKGGHGYLSVVPALAKSCDVFFYHVGLGLKNQPGDIADFARQFGYGAATGLDVYAESAGRVPDLAWWVRTKRANGYTQKRDLNWYPGDTCNYIIGQGDLAVTPLQVLWSAATVAWRGLQYKPHLLLAHFGNNKVIPEQPERPKKTRLNPDVLAIVEQGMRAAVTSGTGKAFEPLGLRVCSKTGTAENIGTDHSWVVGYYPMGAPRYAFVCLVEHGGHGAEAAVPAIKQVLTYMKGHDPIGSS